MTSDSGAVEAMAAPFSESVPDIAAKAVYDAVDPLSGDHIATVIHMSEHLFWDNQMPGDTDIERQLAAVRVICRVAVDATLDALAANISDEMVEAGMEFSFPRAPSATFRAMLTAAKGGRG